MKEEIVIGKDGKQIVYLIPETDEDVKELERMIAEKKVQSRDSFADDPYAWEKNKPTAGGDDSNQGA